MSAPKKPGPGPGWFSSHLLASLPGEAADATAARRTPTPATLRDYLRALRQAAGGAVESLLNVPGQVAEVVSPAVPGLSPLVQHLRPLAEKMTEQVGDVVGGAPQNVSDSSFRQMGNIGGNLAGWEVGMRAPAILSRLSKTARTEEAIGRANRLRKSLELADAQHPPVKTPVAPRQPVPSSIGKLPAEMTAAEREQDAATASLSNLENLKARGIAISPLEQSVKQARHADALLINELGKEGGATLTSGGQHFTGSGYAVARPELTAIVKSPEEMRAFLARPDVQKAVAEGAHYGKWTDPATGSTEINITDIVPSEKRARSLGVVRGQKAVGHIKGGEYLGDVNLPALRSDAVPGVARIVGENLKGSVPHELAPVNPARAKEMAAAYERLPANDPNARPAYDALNQEIAQQKAAFEKAGYRFEFVDHDPYKNSAEMLQDVRENKRLKVFKTGADASHPYMSAEQNNDFRAVHDMMHSAGGLPFGPKGEEAAAQLHASTMSPLASRALLTETRGQNSWVNFGPNAHLPATERPFAPQKAALWPEEFMGPGGAPVVQPGAVARATAAAPEAIPGPARRGNQIGSRADMLQAELGYDHRARTAAPIPGEAIPPAQVFGREEAPWFGRIAEETRPENLRVAIRDKATGKQWVGDKGDHHFDLGDKHAEIGQLENWEDGFVDTKTGEFLTRGEAAKRITPNAARIEPGPLTAEILNVRNGGLPGPWQPTPRGIFNREAPNIQGTASVDPRLMAQMPRGEPSDLAQEIAKSKVVEKGLLGDVQQGLPQGGSTWYEGGPIKQSFDELGGPFSFHDFNLARGSGSIQNPTHNEVASATAMLFGRRQGLNNAADIRAAHAEMHPGEPKLWLNDATLTNYNRAVANDAQLPSSPGTLERKVPWYTQGNEGGSPEGFGALDTHERRRLLQLAATDKRISKLLKAMGITNVSGPRADIVPLLNGLDYELINAPYQRIAKSLNLPSVQAAQAGRWIGGAEHTGLLSQPTGDFTQTLEDAVLHTALTRGQPTDPEALRSLWHRLATGQDFATPVYGKNPFARLGQTSLW